MSVLALLATLAFVACETAPTDPTQTEALFAKGGGKGKPGGGDGGGSDTAPHPTLAFVDAGGVLWVMNDDGSHRTLVLEGTWVRSPSWAPFGEGTLADPYRLVFWDSGQNESLTADIDTEGGQVNVRNIQPFSVSGRGGSGSMEWGPGTGTEMAYIQSTYNPITRQHDRELFILSDVLGASPTATSVYVLPAGHSIGSPAWSPQGDAIAFLEGDTGPGTAVRILNVSSGVVTTLMDFGELDIDGQGLDWSRDPADARLLFTVYRPQKKHGGAFDTHVMDLSGSGGDYVMTGESLLLAGLARSAWSPGDSRIAGTDGRYIKILVMVTGEASSVAGRTYFGPDWRR